MTEREALANVPTSDTSQKRVDEMAKQRHEPEPVIDKSAAVRIATSLGWTPQRTWVGLTDEQIGALLGPFPKYASEWGYGDFYQFARDIEAKLKIKNT